MNAINFVRMFRTNNNTGTFGVVYTINGKTACTFIKSSVANELIDAFGDRALVNGIIRRVVMPAPTVEQIAHTLEAAKADKIDPQLIVRVEGDKVRVSTYGYRLMDLSVSGSQIVLEPYKLHGSFRERLAITGLLCMSALCRTFGHVLDMRDGLPQNHR